jgi:ABC-type branched-subunit amino acid transport system ATPase component
VSTRSSAGTDRRDPLSTGAPGDAILTVEGLSKHFGGVRAIDDVSLEIPPGHICSLIGPNGSGKSTMINVLTGLYDPTRGRISLRGQDITRRRPDERVKLGLARTFQNTRLFRDLPVLENIMTGRHCRTTSGLFRVLFSPASRREEAATRRRAQQELDFVGLGDAGTALAGSLAYGRQRLVEIARALASDPALLLLDEPAAGLNQHETAALDRILRQIVARGITILLVEHDMNLVMGVSDHVTVLNFGKKIAAGTPEQVQANSAVIEAYLGTGDAGDADA